ncbi:alternative ribosome rescue aminoacyl-tRNA hydrolase ArfB [Gammaproteobacteria bacterium]|nr:alternative ribosome rescue aminoacyl-tRNA hydrolase ArfB [Gammaproteobacteria bacterium]
MIIISNTVHLPENELEFHAIRAQGAGGQNVNKVSSAIHLRFNILESSLPAHIKARLLQLRDQRITRDGVVIIKAQEHRTQEKNKQEAINRLKELIASVLKVPKYRVPTKPKIGAVKKRLERKTKQGRLKSLRGKVSDY